MFEDIRYYLKKTGFDFFFASVIQEIQNATRFAIFSSETTRNSLNFCRNVNTKTLINN